jgi:uncharacterized protein
VGILQIEYDGFDWDSGNIKKAQKHGVSLNEIEEFFRTELLLLQDEKHSKLERRTIAVGMSKANRPMFVVFTIREREELVLIRVVSARYAHKKESEHYEKLKKRIQENG